MSAYSCEEFRARIEARARLEGRGSGDAIAWHRHLVECTACRSLLEETERLDELLAALPEPELPPALVQRVRAALEPARRHEREEEKLDRLLDELSAPDVPAGLSERVLAGLKSERVPSPLRLLRRPAVAVAAALLLILFAAFGRDFFGSPSDPAQPGLEPLADLEELESEDELIAYALENWELLMSDEIEVYLASLDPSEQTVLELLDDWEMPLEGEEAR